MRPVLWPLEDRSVPATFAVNTTADSVDANPGDGVAVDSSGNTSVRAAVMEANALAGADVIQIPAGTYQLTIAGAWNVSAASGDLDVTEDLTVQGSASGVTEISAAGMGERIFDLSQGPGFNNRRVVNLDHLQLTDGVAIGSSSQILEDRGGAVRISFYNTVGITNCTFLRNAAPRTSSGLGGAISTSGFVAILDSRFEGNSSSNDGGAIYAAGTPGDVAIRRCSFVSNLSRGGGAIKNHEPMTIDDSTFSGNSGASGGTGQGGAIDSNGGSKLTLTNCTITGNSATFGGAIYNADTIRVVNTTIAGNTAESGGALYVPLTSAVSTFENSIVATNSATIRGPEVSGTVTSLGHNLVGDPAGSTGFDAASGDLINVNPMLAAVADNGGPTQTRALLPGSPAINAANTATAPSTDQRGVPRPQGAAADIGAFEVFGGNSPPVANDSSAGTDEDTPLNGQLSATDFEGDPLTYAMVAGPAHGSVVVNADGTFTYTPVADYNGPDSFTFKANDGTSDSNVATVRITVRPVNDAPVARDDAYATNEDTPMTVGAPGVLANDSDVEGTALSAALVSGPSKGTLTLNANGSFTYTPVASANGTDSITYRASDGSLQSNLSTVTITINPVNDAPVARNDSYTTDEDVPLTIPAPGVLGNDTDADSDPLSLVLVTGPTRGSLQLNPDGSFTYTPNANANGPDSFTYRASDGSLTSNLATVSLTVNPIDDPPVAVAGPDRSSTEGAPVWFDGRASYDPDGGQITAYRWDFGDGGTDTGPTPFHYFTDDGTFTVTLTVTDGRGDTGTDTMVLTVVNVPPAATVSGPATGVRGQPRTFHLTATDQAAVDQAADFTYLVDWGDATGTQTLTGPGNLWVDHAYADVGAYTITVTATDKDGGTGGPATRGIKISAAEMQGANLALGGTVGGDTIIVTPTNSTGGLDVSLNGTSLGTFRPTSRVEVYGQAGNDALRLASARLGGGTTYVRVPAFLFGGEGDDTVDASGSAVGNVLVGSDGVDALTGGRGRDLLLGGLGADVLRGGGNADLLIGGPTDFDAEVSALAALRAEWVRTDVGYVGRINHLTGVTGGGLNGTRFLTGATVHDDAAADQLFGETGQDWFLYRPSGPTPDVLGDRAGSETATEL